MHFEQYDLTLIVDGTRLCPVAVNSEAITNDHVKKVSEWRRDNTKALIATMLKTSVTDLVMTYSSAEGIGTN